MDPNETQHPSSLSDEARAALVASDPAAFDEDGEPDDTGTAAGDGQPAPAAADSGKQDQPGAGDGKSGKDGEDAPAPADGEPAGDAAKGEGNDAPPAGEEGNNRGDMIPKARFDEVNARAKDLDRRVQELERQRAEADAAPARDFGAEIKAAREEYRTQSAALRDQYNDGDIDMDEFERKRDELVEARDEKVRELTKAEAAAEAIAAVDRREAEHRQKTAAEKWESTVGTWRETNADFLANRIRRDAVAALLEEYGKDNSLSDEQLLAKVEQEAFEAFNWKQQAAGGKDEANPHAARNRADAAAAAAASATPSQMPSGVGGRGTQQGSIDLQNLKPGKFSDLPKTEQERYLGEGALD